MYYMMIETNLNVSIAVAEGTLRRHVRISMVVPNKIFKVIPNEALFGGHGGIHSQG